MDTSESGSEHRHESADLRNSASRVVAAYCGRNPVSVEDLPHLILSVAEALSKVTVAGAAPPASGADKEAPPVGRSPKEPAIAIRRSVTPTTLFCLECGAGFQTLKRHLMSSHGLTDTDYRRKWDLPGTYSLTASKYSERRADLARQLGLGTRPARIESRASATANPRPKAKRARK